MPPPRNIEKEGAVKLGNAFHFLVEGRGFSSSRNDRKMGGSASNWQNAGE